MKPLKNVAASVHQRLLNLARESRRPFNELVQYYALERWLYRLARSDYRNQFVLKGALMLLVWKMPVTRPTRDIDLLGRVSNDPEFTQGIFAAMIADRHTAGVEGKRLRPFQPREWRLRIAGESRRGRAMGSLRRGSHVLYGSRAIVVRPDDARLASSKSWQ